MYLSKELNNDIIKMINESQDTSFKNILLAILMLSEDDSGLNDLAKEACFIMNEVMSEQLSIEETSIH